MPHQTSSIHFYFSLLPCCIDLGKYLPVGHARAFCLEHFLLVTSTAAHSQICLQRILTVELLLLLLLAVMVLAAEQLRPGG